MACKLCLNITRWCLVGLILVGVISSFALASVESDSSYFHYDVNSRSNNIVEHEFLQDELHGVSSRRFRRAAVPSVSTMALQTPVLSQKPQVPTDKPQEPSMIKTENSTASNVTYSTDSATNSTTTEASSSSVTTTTVKADAGTNEKSATIIVSQPIIPVTGQPKSKKITMISTLKHPISTDKLQYFSNKPSLLRNNNVFDVVVTEISDENTTKLKVLDDASSESFTRPSNTPKIDDQVNETVTENPTAQIANTSFNVLNSSNVLSNIQNNSAPDKIKVKNPTPTKTVKEIKS
ncbi:hypothetical protein PV327_004577 [Microctonus hyperodae]|uniref:Uncharacterized protein n=1 Tax=Microctonus hyperodae TaxID=165561 RepID=A0AA39KMU8_MICHY|nr:hypothetical protein PV327_004577 [Microctonus hyperodae]